MAKGNECTHGYAPYDRRHCVHCTYSDEIADRDAQIARLTEELADERSMTEALRCDFEGVQESLDDVVERSLKRKEALYAIQNATMSMFHSTEDMAQYMKKTARRALSYDESNEETEN